MITFAPHYLPLVAYPINNAMMICGKCPRCGDCQTYEKFYATHRDVCILSDDLLIVKCWKCDDMFTYSCMKTYLITWEELETIPPLSPNWGIPF